MRYIIVCYRKIKHRNYELDKMLFTEKNATAEMKNAKKLKGTLIHSPRIVLS